MAKGVANSTTVKNGGSDSLDSSQWQRTAWDTPPLLLGGCSTTWTTSFAKYFMPYLVIFGRSGYFRWWAHYKNGMATEVGEGVFLSAPVSTVRADGSWETHYFSANRFRPNADKSTNCACEYVGGEGTDKPRVLADYILAVVPNSAQRPMPEVCAPYMRQCPVDNATAYEVFGRPFIEIYESCGRASAETFSSRAAFTLVAVLMAACVLRLALFA
eukprot:CAMPEP_0117606050 /NCGR_PEP_ID=MMETSP0784-20121206/79510_1 /TAXON_ID=39447 /ORGANISM="" /LENGTH=214 /DNA_ID=CAMNT_0005409115 /DNA_START=297 /DNA_END=937 /DNA_ORIENTATION=+